MSTISKVVVFGSTGQTGLCVLDAALKKGLNVTAFVRDVTRLPTDLVDKVNVVQGDSTRQDDVNKAVEGQDVVIVTLGTRNDLSPTTVMSDSLKAIIAAMHTYGVKKISVCLSSFLFWEPEKVPERFANINTEHLRMLDILKSPECESLDWVAVLPPHIADAPSSNGQFVVTHNKGPGRQIPKWDLGEFMVDCLGKEEHRHQLCGLAFPVVAPPA